MKKSLFIPLREEGLTTLKIRHNFKDGSYRLYAAKEWEPDFDFAGYNHEWYLDDIYTEDAVYLNTKQVYDLYKKYDLYDYLLDVLDLVKQGKHFGITAYYFDKYDIRYMMNEHSRKLGVLNKSQAIMAGGIRRHSYEEEERNVIIDGLNLGRGMSFKNIAAGLPYGGCKATVTMDEVDINNLEIMGFCAFAIDACRDMTGPDMNFPTESSDVMIKEGYTMGFTGGPHAKTGETGKPTAYGIYLTMKQAARFKYGSDSLDGKSVAVMGLGAVGWYMSEYLLQEDAILYISDLNEAIMDEFIEKHPGKIVGKISVDDVLYADVNILCPCAIGGIFDDESIPKLNCDIVWGSANNQLKASSQEEEYRLAKIMQDNNILFQSEWWHNAAGVICGAEEYLFDGTFETLLKKIDEKLPKSTWENLNEAKEKGITATENCYTKCEKIIYS